MRPLHLVSVAGATLFALAAPVTARAPLLNMPLECTLGEDCFIQNYVDADGGPGNADFTCGPLTYDGHKGTDIAIPSLAAMEAGVEVFPAAPGTVTALRDGEPDTGPTPETLSTGRECGNGVVLDHGDGWETQYCHMKRGSIAVQTGQRVGNMTVLGQIGLSGQTEFPHIHLALRHEGRVVDPFNPDGLNDCAAPRDTLWQEAPTYLPGGIIGAGFSTAVPDYAEIKQGRAGAVAIATTDPALVIWGYAFGARAGDMMALQITGPQGAVISEEVALDRTQAQLFRAVGRRTPPGGWPAGTYDGTVTLVRAGAPLDTATVRIEVTP